MIHFKDRRDHYEQIKEAIADKSCQEQINWLVGELKSVSILSPEHVTQTKELAGFASLAIFAKMHFDEMLRLPFGKHHDIFFNLLGVETRGVLENILAPRGAAKSQVLAVFLPIHRLYYRYLCEEFDIFADRFILIVSRSYNLAADRCKDIRRQIEQKPSLRHLKGRYTWGMRRSISANFIQFVPESRGGQVRGLIYDGFRPSLIIADDLDDIESLRNPETRKNDEDWFNSDLMECGDKDTNIINVDTVKSEHGISNQLRWKPNWRTNFIQAIANPPELIHPKHESLWNEYRQLYTDISTTPRIRERMCDEFYSRNRHLMEFGVVETWHEKWTYREIREKEFSQGRGYILREFQNYAIDREKAIFDMANAVRFKAREDAKRRPLGLPVDPIMHHEGYGDFDLQMGRGDIAFVRSDGRQVNYSELSGATIYLDWAGIKDTLDNCFASVVVVVWEPVIADGYDGLKRSGAYGYVWDAWLDRGNRKYQLEALVNAYEKVSSWLLPRQTRAKFKICVEDVIDTTGDRKENFRRHYETIRRARQIQLPLLFVSRTKNKEERIADLENPIGNGWLAFREGLDERFLAQLAEFPVGEFLDGPDALEGAWSTPVRNLDERRATSEEKAERASERFPLGHVRLSQTRQRQDRIRYN